MGLDTVAPIGYAELEDYSLGRWITVSKSEIMRVYREGVGPMVTLVTGLSDKMNLLVGEIATQSAQIALQLARIAELEARLHMNSSNSSKPPSSDGLNKRRVNSREKGGKPSGGQVGHEGKTLEKVEKPDTIVDNKLPETCECGQCLTDVAPTSKSRQVFDVPKITIQVTEYISYEAVCPGCGKVHKTEFPLNVTQPTQYGPNMLSIMTYLTMFQLLPLERAAQAIHEMTGQAVSEGTLVNAARSFSEMLDEPIEAIKSGVIGANVANFDETGMRSQGKINWLHVACTPTLTHYEVHPKRGKEAAQAIGILPGFRGTAMHDHWKPYYSFEHCTHAECNAHHLRTLKDIAENYHQDWAKEMAGLLIECHREVDKLKADGLNEMPQEIAQKWVERYEGIIERGIAEDALKSPQQLNKKGVPKKSKPLQLLTKLREYDIETLAFMFDFAIPFDNNLAERDIRMQKLRQKISGCFRGSDGAKVFCRIRSYLSTARKNGIGVMEAISKALTGHPFIPES